MWVLAVARILLVVLALRGKRWAYVLFIVLGLAYFPLSVGFHLQPRGCQLAFDARHAAFSLTNYPHIVLFGLFFMLSAVHFGGRQWTGRSALTRAAVVTVAMGAAVELAEGVTGNGNCRLRDLIPDSAGIALGADVLVLLDEALRRIPALLRSRPSMIK